MSATKAWLVLTAFGTAVMVGLQLAFRQRDPHWVAPLAQAFAFTVTWIVAWPVWYRYQPKRRFGFVGHAVVVIAVAGTIAAVRIVLRVG